VVAEDAGGWGPIDGGFEDVLRDGGILFHRVDFADEGQQVGGNLGRTGLVQDSFCQLFDGWDERLNVGPLDCLSGLAFFCFAGGKSVELCGFVFQLRGVLG